MDGRARSASSVQPSARGSHRRAAKSPTELTNDLTKLIVRAAGTAASIPQQQTAPAVVSPGRHHAEPPPPPVAPPPPSRFRLGRPQLLAAAGIAAAAAVAVPLLIIWTPSAQASGTTVSPSSRGDVCRPGTPIRETSRACRAAAAEVRTDSDDTVFGDGADISIPDVGSNHREVIPDTRLCSAGRERYRGLDLARDDWPTTDMPSGGTTTLEYQLDDQHDGTLRFYLTRIGYKPTEPLTWAALEPKPLHEVSGKPGADNVYRVSVKMPERSGRHLIYTIWEQADSDAALYACSDVLFGGTAGSSPNGATESGDADSRPAAPAVRPSTASPSPTASPSAADSGSDDPASAPPWEAEVDYDVGDLVRYDDIAYRCLQPHRSVYGWEPDSAPALWELAT
ncbi:lytic polysaccharide monooxygenase [Cryptosporangium aurantiacum]|uniref:Chitin-binding protein n=1 Tax=Cryptosporangium aurantiacum TaxID=134849 RepID=A0A1M7H0I8_9ACTN|nr:lytic polysaccharide monooxygenase [Cryptosporangium aurantiacum]SHM22154.1 chitin-binding protein [Cryptosporangium aurantiacum]